MLTKTLTSSSFRIPCHFRIRLRRLLHLRGLCSVRSTSQRELFAVKSINM